MIHGHATIDSEDLLGCVKRGNEVIFERVEPIEDKRNQRPRKRLGNRTPEQMFELPFNRDALHG